MTPYGSSIVTMGDMTTPPNDSLPRGSVFARLGRWSVRHEPECRQRIQFPFDPSLRISIGAASIAFAMTAARTTSGELDEPVGAVPTRNDDRYIRTWKSWHGAAGTDS